MQHEYFLNRQMQLALYSLKRQYGSPVTAFHILSRSTDPRTGEPSARYLATRIRLAVVLPTRISRDVERTISLISSNKQLVQGGGFDIGKRTFLIDRRDTGPLALEKDDFLVHNRCKYAIDTLDEFASAYLIIAEKLIGETFDDGLLAQSLHAGSHAEVEAVADQFRVLNSAADDQIHLASGGEGEV
jgi:hypothetical protein